MARFFAVYFVLAFIPAAPAAAQTGVITGIVTRAATGLSVPGVEVWRCTQSLACLSTTTNGIGVYTMVVSPGTYYLHTVNALGLIDEIHDNIQCPGQCNSSQVVALGVPAVVTAGSTITRSFSLELGGIISGTVVNADTAVPVAGVDVNVVTFLGPNIALSRRAVTNSFGNYQARGLPSGNYYAYTSNDLGLLDELYANVPCRAQCALDTIKALGIPIAVTAGATTPNKIFALTVGGRVSGVVRDSSTLGAISDVVVEIAIVSAGQLSAIGSDTTDASGAYQIDGVPSGTYYAFTRNNKGYINEVHSNVPCHGQCVDPAGGLPFAVTAGVLTSHKNFELELGGSITGVVMRAAGDMPVSTGFVNAFARGPDGRAKLVDSVPTDTGGLYHVRGLVNGTYYLNTSNREGLANEIFDNLPCQGACDSSLTVARGVGVVVTQGSITADKNFALDLGGRISGTVRSSNGLPIVDIGVEAVTVIAAGTLAFAGSASTDGSGNYELEGLQAGQYALYTSVEGYVNEIFNEVLCLGECDAATAVTAGQPVAVVLGANTTGIDFQLSAGGAIAGIVRSSGGAGLSNLIVRVYRNTGDGPARLAGRGVTNASGAYVIPGLPAGAYFVATFAQRNFQNHVYPAANCFRQCSPEFVLAHGTPVTVTTGVTSGGIDFALDAPTGFVQGVISNSTTSTPIAGASVDLYTRVGSGYVLAGSDSTDEFGRYAIGPLSAGTYFALTRSRGPYVDAIYSGIPCLTACDYGIGALSNGSPIVLATGTATVHFELQPLPATQAPGAPTSLAAHIANGAVAFSWSNPNSVGIATDYLLGVGLAAGTSIVSLAAAGRTHSINGVPPGRYFARVHGKNSAGIGPPSSEYEFVVNHDGSGAPDPPTNLLAFHDSSALHVSWAGALTGGVTTGYLLEVGTAAGLSNIAAIPVGPRSVFTYGLPIPSGVYFLRVRARNAGSVSRPTPDVMFVSGDVPAPPDPPGHVGFAVDAARRVIIGWSPPKGSVIQYLLEAGSVPGGSDIGVFPMPGNATSVPIANVPPGIYYARMRSVNAQGVGVASYDVPVIVP